MHCELCEFLPFCFTSQYCLDFWETDFWPLELQPWTYDFFLIWTPLLLFTSSRYSDFFNPIIPQCWLLFWLHSTEIGNPLTFLHIWSAIADSTVSSWATSCWCSPIIVFRKCSVLLLYSLSHLHVMLYMQLEVCSHFIKAWLWSGISKGWNYSWILSGCWCMDYKSSESFPTCLS